MLTNHRYVPLANRACPECGRPVTAVCKAEDSSEEYWFACNSARYICMWGEQTPTQYSDGGRVTRTEATATFDARYGE